MTKKRGFILNKKFY